MKKLRFLVDVGVGKKVEQWLIENGHDVRVVRDINPSASDIDILNVASSEARMVITMDKDFGELVYNSGRPHAGVLILRLEQADGKTKAEVVQKIINRFADRIENCFCVYQDGRLRIRKGEL
jgi:predicted nuclease of predicted toxin-antitoxin system